MVFFVADSSTGDLSTSVEPQRKQDEDQRPFAGRAAHLERPAPGLRPVAEADQARAAGRIGAPRAVVADRQTEAVASLLGGDAHDRGVRMPGRVGERLGDDVIPAPSTGSGTRPIAARSSSTPIEVRRASFVSGTVTPAAICPLVAITASSCR